MKDTGFHPLFKGQAASPALGSLTAQDWTWTLTAGVHKPSPACPLAVRGWDYMLASQFQTLAQPELSSENK